MNPDVQGGSGWALRIWSHSSTICFIPVGAVQLVQGQYSRDVTVLQGMDAVHLI